LNRGAEAVACTLVLALGCNASHVAAVLPEGSTGVAASSSTSGVSTSDMPTGTTEDPSSSSEDSTGSIPCEAPVPLEDCDAAADPLRAPEISCFDGITAARFDSIDPDAWRRARELGNAQWVSEESEAILVLSTGLLPQPGMAAEVNVEPGASELTPTDNGNPAVSELPGNIVAAAASDTPYVDCDGVGDCSGTLATAFSGTADDLLWLAFDAAVPPGVRGYSIRVGFLSAAYPEDLGADVSDLFVWWHASEDYVGNLATWQGAPANVQGLGPRMHTFSGEHPFVLRTGVDGTTGETCDIEGKPVPCPIGAATEWMELRAPATAGEVVQITAALFDQSALPRDTTVVLDGFRWTCETCTPGVDCGLQ
jgi:hypothetical protein